MNDLDVIRQAGADSGFQHTIGQWVELLRAIDAQGWELAERLDDDEPQS